MEHKIPNSVKKTPQKLAVVKDRHPGKPPQIHTVALPTHMMVQASGNQIFTAGKFSP